MKSIVGKVFFGMGILLLICFFGGLAYMYYYQANTAFTYGSTPQSVYNIIHGIIFLPPSIICFIISWVIRSKSNN